ncbi:Eco57I restriction-modification methylase domain-containing protein [Micromonospora lutea]|uniref:site-specific DNA-methyltransferase (adenine-specific) n=1 Tax=Micromonospora lutea TaxID=419825 RepID=A0ABQ4ITW1_9ACTN|nr:N-6 DNA methylase [Micromonospora lutea]GIJ21216.1 type II endonuclease-methyltransferasefusion protein [Micromonospora lutea]
MASLFGRSKLRERAQEVDLDRVREAIRIVEAWHQDYHEGSLKKDKETSREQAYNQDFFIRILGFREKPSRTYTFEPKATTEKRQLPDALISYTDDSQKIRNVSAVVELKGASVDLDRPQRREGNLSPVQQGFKYKTQYRVCPFVIVSNFWEIRLYNDNQLDYESWTLDELVDPTDDYFAFRTFYSLLHSSNLTSERGPSRTQALLSDIRVEQEEIGKEFYSVYRDARLNLLRDIYIRNDAVRSDIELGIEKAQKIIDRIVFTCFAEDRGLLPDNTLQQVVQFADKSTFGGSLWNTLKGFFDAVDVGSSKLGIPEGYNGGLFASDPYLNNLQVGDEALRAVTALSNYNFVEDLSVNILGHIFEQSISDLEQIKAKVEAKSRNLNAVVEEERQQTSRRKKDGIFYTPDYIVRYIVENSLGSYLRQIEERCKAEYGLKAEILDATYEKREKQAYSKYQDFLQNIRVLDPACGSGAFLVHVLDYLLAENQRVDAILGGSLMSVDDYVREILQRNIYGVDVNEESVEITKLSLWLKTARPGKKLTALDGTIRCGNSLISDPAYAGKRAFDWQLNFKDVFSAGGFDVIVGNPPYVRSRDNSFDDVKEYIRSNFANLHEKPNLYLLFMEQSMRLLRDGGKLGFVVPNSWLGMESAKKTRKMLLDETTLERFVNLKGESFEGVNVETVVFVLSKAASSPDHEVLYQTIDEPSIESMDYQKIPQARWLGTANLIFDLKSDASDFALLDRLARVDSKVEDFYDARVGMQAYERGRGTPPQTAEDVRGHVFDYRYKFDEFTYPYLEGRDVLRYGLSWSGQWLRYGRWLSQPKEFRQFSEPRLLIREITGQFPFVLYGAYTTEIYLNNKSILNVLQKDDTYSLKFLLGILNSSLIGFYHQRRAAKGNRTLFPKIVANDLKNYPIPATAPDAQQPIVINVDRLLEENRKLQDKSHRFQRLVKSEFSVDPWPSKLATWWRLDFAEFTRLLKTKISLRQKDELLELFDLYARECSKLEEQVRLIDTDIDEMVFDLYGLSAEEKALVRGMAAEAPSA